MAEKNSDWKWKEGDQVRRASLKNGNDPSYRFPGTVCGTYTNPVTGQRGYNVSNNAEPGLIQIFNEYMLEDIPPEGTFYLYDHLREAYWRPLSKGYTNDKSQAGHFTQEEVEKVLSYSSRQFTITPTT